MSTSDKDRMRTIAVGDHEFRIGDEVASIYSGAVHPWRLDRGRWDEILDRIKGAGLTNVSVYVPWEAHEVERGNFDFGDTDPSKDLDAFLTLCKEKGLGVIARPGPQINAEMTWFGFPRRILEDPDLDAKSAQGSKTVLDQVPRPIPARSYAADKFFEEVALYYDAVCPILARHQYPEGPLVAVQVDNEMAFFFNINPYAADFSDASLHNYRAFLQEKYGSIETLGEAYGQSHESFDEVEPPRRFEGKTRKDIPHYADWIEYRERYLVDCLDRLAGMMRQRGLTNIPLFHNYPHPLGAAGPDSGFATPPFNLPALEQKLDFAGFDIYFRKEMYDHLKTTVSYVVGSSRYPYVPEFVAGAWPWFVNPGDLEDEEFVAKGALMHGIKGFSRYMLVERNRWMASPIGRDGQVRERRYEMFARVNEMAGRHRLADAQRHTGVLLLANREYDRLEAASVLISFPADFLETPTTFSGYPSSMYVSEEALSFEEPIQLAKGDRFMQYYNGLTDAGYGFLISDTALEPQHWRSYGAVALASFEYMDTSTQRALVDFAEGGGLVVLGPRVPHLDERMRPDETLSSALSAAEGEPLTIDGAEVGSAYSVGQGRIAHITDMADPARTLEAALRGFELPRIGKNDTRLDVTVHRDTTDSGRMIVFVANPTDETISAKVDLQADLKSVTDIWEEKLISADGSSLSQDLPPYTVGIYECTT